MSINYNNFKQSTIRGAFRNEDYENGSIKASAYIQNDISVSGQIYTNNINTININKYNFNSLINSLSGSIFNNFTNQNLINNSLSGLIFNNFTNQNLINNSLSGSIYNNFNSINTSVSDIQVITNKFFWSGWANYLTLNTSLNLTDKLYFAPTSQITIGSAALGYQSVICTNLLNLPYLDISASIQTEFNKINTLLTGTTYESNYLKFSNNVQVFGNLALNTGLQLVLPGPTYKYLNVNTLSYLTNVSSDIQQQINNITPSTEVSSFINSLSGSIFNNNINQNLYSISLSGRLNNYIISNNNYVISLSGRINNYVISNNLYTLSLSGRINNNNNIQNSNLNNYIISNNLNILTLSSIIYNNDQSSNLNNYIISNNNYVSGLSGRINDNYNIIQSNINYIASNYVPNLELLNYAKLYTNLSYLLDINGNLNATTIYENGTLLSSKYLGVNGTAAVSTRAVNIAVTSDNTSTALCLVMTSSSATTTSTFLKIDSNLRFNCSTNTLTSNIIGNITGNCSGSSGSCTGNSQTSTVANTITVTADNTSTSLFIPLITGASPTEIKVDQGLSFNCVTNTLTTTNFNGNVLGTLNGISSYLTISDAISTYATITTLNNYVLKISPSYISSGDYYSISGTYGTPVGDIGHIIAGVLINSMNTATYYNLSSITLGVGVWTIHGNITINNSNNAAMRIFISNTSLTANNYYCASNLGYTSTLIALSLQRTVCCSSSTIFYFVGINFAGSAFASGNLIGQFYAVKIA
jgi:hypothetical protein